MPHLSRLSSLFCALLFAVSASAQTTFNLHNPTLVLDGQYWAVQGAPLSAYPFAQFYLNVPRLGTFVISVAPFEGSQRAGGFNDTYLELSLEGHTVQLWSSSRLLSAPGLVAAHARLDAGQGVQANSATVSSTPIRVQAAVAERSPPPISRPTADTPPPDSDAAHAARTAAERAVAEAQLTANRNLIRQDSERLRELRAENAELLADLARLREQRDELERGKTSATSERARLMAEIEELRRNEASPEALARLREQRDELQRANAAAATDRERLAADIEAQGAILETRTADLERERARLESGGTALAAQVSALRSQNESLSAEVARLQAANVRLGTARQDLLPSQHGGRSDATSTSIIRQLETARDEAAAERDEYAVITSSLRRTLVEMETRIDELENQQSQLMQDRVRIIADRDQVMRERDALHREVERMQLQESESTSSNRELQLPPVAEEIGPAADNTAPADGHQITLPEFDFERLANAAEVRRFIADVELPNLGSRARTVGEVLVLFVTDADGWVVRTEVTEPLGNGLDIVAEQIVRTMHFKVQTVQDMPAALRSQVRVAFSR